MSSWFARYRNDDGEYEITFQSKSRDVAKVVERVCQIIMDGGSLVFCDECVYVHRGGAHGLVCWCPSGMGGTIVAPDDYCSCGVREVSDEGENNPRE